MPQLGAGLFERGVRDDRDFVLRGREGSRTQGIDSNASERPGNRLRAWPAMLACFPLENTWDETRMVCSEPAS